VIATSALPHFGHKHVATLASGARIDDLHAGAGATTRADRPRDNKTPDGPFLAAVARLNVERIRAMAFAVETTAHA